MGKLKKGGAIDPWTIDVGVVRESRAIEPALASTPIDQISW